MKQNIFSWIEKGAKVVWDKDGKEYEIDSEVFFDEDENEDEIPNENDRESFNVVWIANDTTEQLVYVDEIKRLRHIPDLSYDELKKLRSQIVLGSIYLDDYSNTLGVPTREVSDYADGFENCICSDEEITEEDREMMRRSPEECADYCQSVES